MSAAKKACDDHMKHKPGCNNCGIITAQAARVAFNMKRAEEAEASLADAQAARGRFEAAFKAAYLAFKKLKLKVCTCPWPADAEQTRHILGCPADRAQLDLDSEIEAVRQTNEVRE